MPRLQEGVAMIAARITCWLLIFALAAIFIAAAAGFDLALCAYAFMFFAALLLLVSSIKPHTPVTVFDVLRKYERVERI
jgi:hypothetical protein